MILLFAFLQTVPVRDFARIDAPGGIGHDLQATVDRACDNPTGLDRVGLLAREDRLAVAAHDGDPPAATWAALGCARAALAGDGAMSRPGLLMVAGNSWAAGDSAKRFAPAGCSKALQTGKPATSALRIQGMTPQLTTAPTRP